MAENPLLYSKMVYIIMHLLRVSNSLQSIPFHFSIFKKI